MSYLEKNGINIFAAKNIEYTFFIGIAESRPWISALKGQCLEIFDFRFFHEPVSPKPLSIPIGPFRILSLLKVVHLDLQYLREFSEQLEMTLMLISGAARKMIHEAKNLVKLPL